MKRQDAEELLNLAIPKGSDNPVVAKALERIDRTLDMHRQNGEDLPACLRLLRLMVADADIGLYDHIAKTQPDMWNDSTSNGIRTWVARLKEFAACPAHPETPAPSSQEPPTTKEIS